MIGGIPFEKIRTWLAKNAWASPVFVIVLAIVSLGFRLAIAPLIQAPGLVSVLPLIVIIAYLAGPRWAYAALALNALLVWFFILPPAFTFVIPRKADLTDLALFAISGIAVIEFVRFLDRALKSAQAERQRAAALAAERQILMDELAHRTSNNFQMVSGMLLLARKAMTDPAAKRALTEASERVAAMGVVQRHLSQATGDGIELNGFLPLLCADLQKALGTKVVYAGQDLGAVSTRIISSLALVVQEFAANAVEHGSRPGFPVSVSVTLAKSGAGRGTIFVEDDGKGIFPGFDPAASGSLGLTLVQSFVQSIAGSLDIRNRPDGDGVVALVEFPLADLQALEPPLMENERLAAMHLA